MSFLIIYIKKIFSKNQCIAYRIILSTMSIKIKMLVLLSIEKGVLNEINYDNLIDNFT